MAQHARFHYASLDELKADIAKLGVDIPVSANTAVLGQPIKIGNKTVPNRLAINPMEGCDGTADGRPGELTRRRYRRFAEGGAGLLWYEATAVVDEGRANPRQLSITEDNAGDFAAMLSESLFAAKAAGFDRPYTVLKAYPFRTIILPAAARRQRWPPATRIWTPGSRAICHDRRRPGAAGAATSPWRCWQPMRDLTPWISSIATGISLRSFWAHTRAGCYGGALKTGPGWFAILLTRSRLSWETD